jgi:NADH dehydrogenase
MPKKIVIIGAGYAGIEAALFLNKRGKTDVDITVIDRNPYHTLLTEIHEIAGNRVSEGSVKVPLKRIFRHTHVKSVADNITRFDFESKKVASDNNEYTYDYLIISIGSVPNYFGIPGLEENCFPMWSLKDAIAARDHIERCFYDAEREDDPERRKRLLTFVVGGAGFTGVETIGELAQWIKKLRRQYGFDRKEIRLVLVDMLNCVLSSLCDKNSRKAYDYMSRKQGIEIMLGEPVKEVTKEYVDLGDCKIDTNTLIWTAGVRASTDADRTGLEQGQSSRLKVDEFCRTKYDDVYAVGDVGALLDEKGKPYPAMVETALQTGKGAASNILKSIKGKPPEPVKVKLHGVMVSIGNYYAVADLIGMKPPKWISLSMKYLVNAHYLNGILGISGVWHYFRDEFLHRRQYKRFLQRHYTKTVQAWWLVPLRLLLGWTWFYDGLKKIWEGWFVSAKLASFLGVVANSDSATSASPAAGAASSATQAGAAAIEKLLNIDLGFIGFYLERAGDDAPIVFRMNFFLVDWILNGWVLSTEGWSMFFQVLVVILELLVGLAIFSGTFTFLAAVVSLGLMAMFITTTGIYDYTWWMLFAGIAMAAGAGRAFGLDHWLLPYLGRVWDASKKNGRLLLTFRKVSGKK